MSNMYLSSVFAASLFLAGMLSAQQTDVQKLADAIRKELAVPAFAHTIAAVEIRDCVSGAVLFSQHRDLLLRPASNAKLFPSAAAVLGLPRETVYRTSLSAVDSSFHTLICTGGGDPLFGVKDIQKLAENAYALGVTRIDTLYLDGSLFDAAFFGAGWMWDDESDPFMPYLSSLPVEGNAVRVTVSAPARPGLPVDVDIHPSSSLITVDNTAVSASRSDLSIEKVPRSNHILVRGKLASGQRTSERLSLWEPQAIFAEQFLMFCRTAGIATDSAVILHESPWRMGFEIAAHTRPIDQVLTEMNKESDNLCAESILRLLAVKDGSTRGVSASDGLRSMKRILSRAGIQTYDLHLRDGSGISFYNLVTPRCIGDLLTTMATHPSYNRFAESLAVAGTDGTLKRRQSGTTGTFRGKTGTISGVSALSGYAQAPGGRLLSVVMLMQNFSGSHKPYREIQDRIVVHCIQHSARTKKTIPPR